MKAGETLSVPSSQAMRLQWISRDNLQSKATDWMLASIGKMLNTLGSSGSTSCRGPHNFPSFSFSNSFSSRLPSRRALIVLRGENKPLLIKIECFFSREHFWRNFLAAPPFVRISFVSCVASGLRIDNANEECFGSGTNDFPSTLFSFGSCFSPCNGYCRNLCNDVMVIVL